MNKKDVRAAIIDGVLKTLAVGGSISVALVIPNVLTALDKPLTRYLNRLDKRAREREIRKTLYYLKEKSFISAVNGYEHGIRITKKGKQRLVKIDLDNLKLNRPKHWDKQWRMVFFDIPEKYKSGRDALTRKLKELGFYQLQRSVLVFPHPCKEEVIAVSTAYGINKYVSYIETGHIDQQNLLKRKFRRLQSR